MKLSEFKNGDAIDLIADIIEPAAEIFSDGAVATAANNGKTAKAVKVALKNHKDSVIEILARLDGVEVKKYNKNVLQMTMALMELLNDPELMQVFTWQGQTEVQTSSTSASENTEEADGM